jgi:hypothetical protein
MINLSKNLARIIAVYVQPPMNRTEETVSDDLIKSEKREAMQHVVFFGLCVLRALRQEFKESVVDPEYFRRDPRRRGRKSRGQLHAIQSEGSLNQKQDGVVLFEDGSRLKPDLSLIAGETIPGHPNDVLLWLSRFFHRHSRSHAYKTIDPTITNPVETRKS